MWKRHFNEIECFHTLGTPHLERLKVTALNLFHPTASPTFRKVGSFHITTQPLEGGVKGHIIKGKYLTENLRSLGREASQISPMLLNRKSKKNRMLIVFYTKRACIYNKNNLVSADLKGPSTIKADFPTASVRGWQKFRGSLDNHVRVMLIFGHIRGKSENGPFAVWNLGLVVAE